VETPLQNRGDVTKSVLVVSAKEMSFIVVFDPGKKNKNKP